MPDLERAMLDIAKAAANGDAGNLVFVMRQAMTTIYQQGFEDGMRAERQDGYTAGQINQLKEKKTDAA